MDTKSHNTNNSHKSSELEKFRLFYEFVPVQKSVDRTNRTHATGK